MPSNETKETVMSTPMHEHRLELAKKAKEVVPVIEEWYEWVPLPYHNPKKGRKLVKKARTKNGTSSYFVGWEKQIPSDFFAKLDKEGCKIKQADFSRK